MELWKKTLALHLKGLSDLEIARLMTDQIDCHECPFWEGCDPNKIDQPPAYCDDIWLQHMHDEVKEEQSNG